MVVTYLLYRPRLGEQDAGSLCGRPKFKSQVDTKKIGQTKGIR